MPTTRCKETKGRENQTHQGTSNCQVRSLTSRKLLSKGHVHSRRDMKTHKMVDSRQKCHVLESESSECPTCRFRRCHAPPFFFFCVCVFVCDHPWCVCVRVCVTRRLCRGHPHHSPPLRPESIRPGALVVVGIVVILPESRSATLLVQRNPGLCLT